MTIREVAGELSVSRRWVYKQVDAGRLPVVQLGTGAARGKVLRVDRNDLEKLRSAR